MTVLAPTSGDTEQTQGSNCVTFGRFLGRVDRDEQLGRSWSGVGERAVEQELWRASNVY